MRVLLLSPRTLHFCKRALAHRDAFWMSFCLRYRNRKQKMNWYAKRTRKYLMHCYRAFTLSCFEIGQVALGNAGNGGQICLSHVPPFAQNPDRIFARRQTINYDFWQYNLSASRDRGARLTHNSSRTDILIGGKSGEPFVLALRQNGEFFAVSGLDKLHFGHNGLSIVNLATMPDGSYDDGVAFDIEDDAPVADPQPCSGTALEPLHVAVPGLGEDIQLGVDSPANIGGKPEPLPRGRAGKRDLHVAYIANSNILVNDCIAECNIARHP